MQIRVTGLFGIHQPIIQGGMHYGGLPELAAVVSNTDALAMITALTQRTPESLGP